MHCHSRMILLYTPSVNKIGLKVEIHMYTLTISFSIAVLMQ